MARIQRGDRVKITGTIVTVNTADEFVMFQPDGSAAICMISKISPMAVERADPVDWPPELGDIWKIGPDEFVVAYDHSYRQPVAIPIDGGFSNYSFESPEFRNRNPVLVRRRGRGNTNG
jgi:hypothetical protein